MANYPKNKISQDFVNDISKCVNAYTNNYKAGSIITEFGTNNKVVGIVISGELDVIREDEYGDITILEKLTDNSIFAEQLTYSNSDYIYVKSKTNSTIIILHYDFILKKCARNCENHNILVTRIAELLINKSNLLTQRIDLLSRKTIEDKILTYLNAQKKDNNIVKINLSFSELATYLCIDRSNMMRELKKMEERGIIKREKNIITML